MAEFDEPPRYDYKLNITSSEKGTITMRLVDRINVDDVLLHLINQELWKMNTGEDIGADIPEVFKQFLLKEQITVG